MQSEHGYILRHKHNHKKSVQELSPAHYAHRLTLPYVDEEHRYCSRFARSISYLKQPYSNSYSACDSLSSQ
ncbi:hypothetical protein PBN151_1194 [Paenibacillus sp. NAIST15-1]|nr:hypothetical protein PBN151_1194 [Paenibacillus sp. NAIST15-1]